MPDAFFSGHRPLSVSLRLGLISGILLCLAWLSPLGCALVPATAPAVATSVATSSATHTAYGEGLPAQGGTMGTGNRAMDFASVTIPSGLGLVTDQSFVFMVGKVKAGVLTFKGRLETRSLGQFFIQSMQSNKWRYVGSFNYPEIGLFFARPDRTCTIHINESMFYTWVKVWVTPSYDAAMMVSSDSPNKPAKKESANIKEKTLRK